LAFSLSDNMLIFKPSLNKFTINYILLISIFQLLNTKYSKKNKSKKN